MNKITLSIEGMACSMCESHINNAIRSSLEVEKVTSSAKKAETVVIADSPIPESEFRRVLQPTGYKLESYKCEEYRKEKGFLGKLFSKQSH